MRAGLSLMKNVLTPLAKTVLVPLGLTIAAATDAAIQYDIFGSGTMVVFSNEKIDDLMKIVNSLEDAGFLINVVGKTVENEVKDQKGGFLGILATTFGASLFANVSGGKVIRAGEGVTGVSQGSQCCLIF